MFKATGKLISGTSRGISITTDLAGVGMNSLEFIATTLIREQTIKQHTLAEARTLNEQIQLAEQLEDIAELRVEASKAAIKQPSIVATLEELFTEPK